MPNISKIDNYTEVAGSVVALVERALEQYRSKLLNRSNDRDRDQLINKRHKNNFLSELDLELHSFYREGLSTIFNNLLYVSEEADPEILNPATDEIEFISVVDPLDTSELAVRALFGYTQILIYDRKTERPVISVVGDFFHEIEIYYSYYDGGSDLAFSKTRSGNKRELKCSNVRDISNALITNYFMKPASRFIPLEKQTDLIQELSRSHLGRIGLDFGSIGLCHVASGATDAFIEFAKGFYSWDLLPGLYILISSGGATLGEDGKDIEIREFITDSLTQPLLVSKRTKFVAAANSDLAMKICSKIGYHE